MRKFYCYKERGKLHVESIRPKDFYEQKDNRVIEASSAYVAEMQYRTDENINKWTK